MPVANRTGRGCTGVGSIHLHTETQDTRDVELGIVHKEDAEATRGMLQAAGREQDRLRYSVRPVVHGGAGCRCCSPGRTR